jgi:aspartate--ammonia ligase
MAPADYGYPPGFGIYTDMNALRRFPHLSPRDRENELARIHKGDYPQTIGGGIGESRLCMYFLRKAHIGEVQASVRPKETMEECRKRGIPLM